MARSFMRSSAPRISINERIKQEEKERIKIVREEEQEQERILKKWELLIVNG